MRSVSIAVQDGDDANSSFAIGETGKITVQATFGDFIDGSETHTVTITAPDAFTIGDVVGSLPTGVSIQRASDTTVVLSVDSKEGDGQDGVGRFSATFAVTNVAAPSGPAQSTADDPESEN